MVIRAIVVAVLGVLLWGWTPIQARDVAQMTTTDFVVVSSVQDLQVKKVIRGLRSQKGVKSVDASKSGNQFKVIYNANRLSVAQIENEFKRHGIQVRPVVPEQLKATHISIEFM